jgi:hypothetical protein
MTGRTLRMVLRAVAIAIAIAALIDPVFSIERSAVPTIALIDMTSGTVDAVRQSLDRAGATILERTPAAGRIPCAPGEQCAIVADGTVVGELPSDVASPWLFVDRHPQAPNVRMVSATLSNPHALAASSARVTVEGQAMAGSITTVRLRDGDVVLGTARHEWKSDGAVTLDVPWLPIATGPRVVRVEAVADPAERSAADNAVDLPVDVTGERLPVLVFDARPSWHSTFVRRALEDDPRFLVEHRARVAPALATATPAGRLDDRTLDLAAVLIVGAPDGLSEVEVSLIDRFVRVRGGTAMLLPERPLTGAAARLLSTAWAERLVAEPQPIGPLHATELLHVSDVPLGSTVLGRDGDRPVIVLLPRGEGAVLVSGAMDAWRYRAGDNAFDRFWTSAVAEAAATSRALQIDFGGRPAIAGSRQPFRVRARAMAPSETIEAAAIARCGSTVAAVRLWPEGSAATFAGELAVPAASTCELEVSAGELRVTSGIAVAAAPAASTAHTLTALEHMVTRAGGAIARADEDASTLLDDGAATPQRSPIHPLRSPWWMVPFALCLSGEWWLRRRAGLR